MAAAEETTTTAAATNSLVASSKRKFPLNNEYEEGEETEEEAEERRRRRRIGAADQEEVFVDDMMMMTSEEDGDEEGVKCIKCEKSFPEIFSLDSHMVEHHSYKPNQYQCEHCSKSFAWRPNLLRHKMVHGEFRRFPCENCDKVFTDPSNLQRHIRTNHVGARCHACPECGKTFATSSGLKQHTHIHSSVKPFRCEVCFKSYTQFSNLCRHKRMHANCRMQIKCHKCGQAFSTVTSLSKHRRFCDSTPSPLLLHAQQQQQQQQKLFEGKSRNVLTPNTSPARAAPTATTKLSPMKLASETNGLHAGVGGLLGGGGDGHLKAAVNSRSVGSASSSPVASPNFYSQAAVAAMAAAAASQNFLSPFAHLLHANNLNAAASGGNPFHHPSFNLLQSPFFPNVLRNIAAQQQQQQQQQHLQQQQQQQHILNTETLRKKSDGSPRDSNVINVERPWENKEEKVIAISPKKELKQECEEELGRDDDKESVDFNRNISDENSKAAANGENKKKENPLDLSVTKKEDEIDSIADNDNQEDNGREEEEEEIYTEEETEDEVKSMNIEAGDRQDEDKKDENQAKQQHELKEQEDEGEEEGNEMDEQEEKKGFQPVREGQSFIPVKDRVSSTKEDGPQNPFYMAPSLRSNMPPNCPRPVHPLLEAMYRMHSQQQQQQQHQHQQRAPSLFGHQQMGYTANPATALLGGVGEGAIPRPPFMHHFLGNVDHASLLNRSAHAPGYHGLSRGYPDMIPKNKDRYSCKFCGKVFPRSANLTRHLRTHTGEQPYKCKYCERSFSISSNLQRHVRNIHNKEKPFKCPLCDRSFGQQTNLDRHLKKHEDCSDPSAIVDSPEGHMPDDDASLLCDDIRSFMGKVTDSGLDDALSDEQEDIDVEDDDISVEHV